MGTVELPRPDDSAARKAADKAQADRLAAENAEADRLAAAGTGDGGKQG